MPLGLFSPSSTLTVIMPPIPKRAVLLLTLVVIGFIYIFSPPSTSSYFDAISLRRKTSVPEIYGVIHLVTGDAQHTLAHDVTHDPTKPVDMRVYAVDGDGAGGEMDWVAERKRIDTEYPVIIFSKSYCPYSRRLKTLLLSPSSPHYPSPVPPLPAHLKPIHSISPQPLVIEVDLRDDAAQIKTLLNRITGRGTFPNMLILGESIGGADDVIAMHERGELLDLLQSTGITVGDM